MTEQAKVGGGIQTRLETLSTSGRYLLGILFFVSVFNFLDRQVLSIVQEAIKVDLELTDSQLGMFALAFGIAHALLALPIGRLADTRFSRKSVLVACLAVWSAMTAVCGVAQNYIQLLIARLGVAAGEAGVTPTTYSMISDKYPIRYRATAISVCSAGIPVGVMLSLFFGGLLADAVGWRMTFILFGVPGLLLAALIAFTVKAPQRGEADGITEVRAVDFWPAFIHLFTTRTFVLVVVGSAFKSIAAYGIALWMPSFYIRKFDLTMAEVGTTFGPTLGIVGLISMFVASYFADKLGEKDLRWYPWIIAGTLMLAFPFKILALTADTYYVSLAFFAVSGLTGSAMLGITNAMVQSTAPVQMRGMASASKTMALSFVGFGLGGALVGLLSDLFGAGDSALGLEYAIMAVSVTYVISGLLFIMSSTSFRQDFDNARLASRAA